MNRKIEGTVDVMAVVLPNGSVDRVRVMKSLDRQYGLDGEAVNAVKRATFEPGTLNGTPVPVLVIYQVQFKLGKVE
jgi:TonB family protein